MLIAALRSGDALAGKAVSYSEDDGSFWLTGVGQIEPAKLAEYDAQGMLDWSDDDVRQWVLGLATGAPAGDSPPPTAKTPPAPTQSSPAPGTPETTAEPVLSAADAADDTPPTAPIAAGDTRVAELEPDEPPSLGSGPAAPPSVAGDSEPPAPVAAPVAVPAAHSLRRQKQPRPDFVEGKRQTWRPNELQTKIIAYSLVGIVIVAIVVVFGIWGTSRGDDTGAEGSGWTAVTDLENTSSGQSEPFDLSTGAARLEFTVARLSSSDATYSISVVPESSLGTTDATFVVAQGVVPAALAAGSKTDAVDFSRPEGTYVLVVTSENCSWSARVLEDR